MAAVLSDRLRERLEELARRAAATGEAQCTRFLTPAELFEAAVVAKRQGVALSDFGGAQGAERRIAAFVPQGEEAIFPIACVRVAWSAKHETIGHRDLLGALLGLGVTRECVGDIFFGEGEAHVFILPEMAQYVEANLSRAGRAAVSAKVVEAPETLQFAEGERIRATVASLRLDVVLGAAWKLSRADAQALIAQGRALVDHKIELRPDTKLREGALISLRGKGRARLTEIIGTTKKGRLSIMLLRY